jgi:hypothetical protein
MLIQIIDGTLLLAAIIMDEVRKQAAQQQQLNNRVHCFDCPAAVHCLLSSSSTLPPVISTTSLSLQSYL